MGEISAQGVKDNCKKVQDLMQWLAEDGKGGYAPLNLV